MNSNNMKNETFPKVSYGDWSEKAEVALKGKKIESLQTNTYENIILKPLYSAEDTKNKYEIPDYPGLSDYRRGRNALGYTSSSWKVAQSISYRTTSELKSKLASSLTKGQTAISFDVKKDLFSKNEWADLLGDHYRAYPFAVDAKGMQTALLACLIELADKEKENGNVTGYVGTDPLALMALASEIPNEIEHELKQWYDNLKFASNHLPNLRTILIDVSTYHNGGANAVQELAIAIGTGSFYIEQMLENGMELNEILSKMVFKFSIGSNFFMETAKLRAARLLWNKVTEAYGAKNENRGMVITAETSLVTKTIKDPQVNILRAGNEAFVAVLGGVQYLHVAAFDELTGSTELSERLARNTQLILKEEVLLQKVIDPAGGSWYIESLTNELAEKAWVLFLKLESEGGILETLKSGTLQKEIAVVQEKRLENVRSRKQSIIGTNVYTNLAESTTQASLENQDNYYTDMSLEDMIYDLRGGNEITDKLKERGAGSNSIKIKPIRVRRLSEPFENLRFKADRLAEKSGRYPAVGLLCIGELKEYKSRADFIAGFLAAGGIRVAASESNQSLKTSSEFIEKAGLKHFCICGSDEQYKQVGMELVKCLKDKHPECTWYLAGLPDQDIQEDWKRAGVQEFIHLKSNCHDALLLMLTEMGAGDDEL
jgi:methylmalonyl-CoA mutase